MRRIIFIAFLLIAQSAIAADLYYWLQDSQYAQVKIVEIDGLKVNGFCKKNKKCQAIESTKNKVTFTTKKGQVGHPYSQACKKVNGRGVFLKDKKMNQYDYCLFQDGSLISSRDLHAKVAQ